MKLSNYLVSWVVIYLGDLQPTYIRLTIYLPSTMDIQVGDLLGIILPSYVGIIINIKLTNIRIPIKQPEFRGMS